MSRKLWCHLVVVVSGLGLMSVGGCRCQPADPAGFVEPALMKNSQEQTAFRRELIPADYDGRKWRSIYVKPIVTSWQLKGNVLQCTSIGTDLLGDDEQKTFYAYADSALRQAVRKSSTFSLAEQPGPETLTLEMAIVKVVPGKPLYHVALLFAVFPLNLAINAVVNAVTDDAFTSLVAMECRVCDGSGRLVMGLAGCEKQKTALLNLLNYTSYGNQRQIVDQWAEYIVRQLALRSGQHLPEPDLFVLINY